MPTKTIIAPRNWHDDATLTATEEAYQCPISNTQNAIRSHVWRSTSTGTNVLQGTLAASTKVNCLGLFRHNGHGGQVRCQFYSDAAWTTQVLDVAAQPLLNLVTSGGYDWGDSRGNDPFVTDSPFVIYFTEQTIRSYKITLSSHASTYGYTDWAISRIFLGKYFELGINPSVGATLGMADMAKRNRSQGGSLRANRTETWRTLQLDLNNLTEAESIAVHDSMRYCGTARDVLVSVFPGEQTRRSRDYTFNGTMSSLDAIGRQTRWMTKRLMIEEN